MIRLDFVEIGNGKSIVEFRGLIMQLVHDILQVLYGEIVGYRRQMMQHTIAREAFHLCQVIDEDLQQ
jgi:hypothetical protein